MPNTPNLGIPHVEQNQSQKEAAINAGFEALDNAAGRVPNVTLTVGAEASNVIQVSIQFKKPNAANLSQREGALIWLSDAANTAPTSDPPSGGWAAGVGYKIHDLTSGVVGYFASDANGLIRVDITEAAADTWYLHALVGNQVYVSGAITFA
jgi:hypothetical protein